MLTLKLMKYEKPVYSMGQAAPGEPPIPTTRGPVCTEAVAIHPTRAVYISFEKKTGRTLVTMDAINGDQHVFTIGDADRDDVMFNCVYVMNEAGKTVETIR